MAAATDYSGWVRELDSYQQRGGDGEADDPRVEATNARPAAMPTARTGKLARPATSQADELQQEMKLLNWHKLANEAALKAAIIKTSKIKKEDAQFASSLMLDEREERAQRVQQIIEEEQLRPLEVSSEFLRDFEAKGQRDEAKLEDDVQRHIQHLRRLKDAMAQKEDAQRRRRQCRERVQELQSPVASMARSVATPPGNQEEDARQQRQQRTVAPNSVYQRIADAQQRGGRTNAEVAGSLDKLMELEKRIQNLEDAGLGVDALDGGQEQADAGLSAAAGSSSVRFTKRRNGGGPHEPSRTVYAVKPAASKVRTKDALTGAGGSGAAKKRPAQPAKRKGIASGGETFLTSLPESKQRQMRRMTDRERRGVLKAERAGEAKQRALKQDVVIDGWLDKKRQAAAQRKATSSQVRAAGGSGTSGKSSKPGNPATGATSRRLPAPPKVRAPAVGAASGKRISALNPHMQRFDDLKRGFDKRREMLQRAPQPTAVPRAAPARSVGPKPSQRGVGGTSQRQTPSTSGPQLSVAGGIRLHAGASLAPPSMAVAPQRVGNAQVSLALSIAPGNALKAAARPATKLPSILPNNATLPASNARTLVRDAASRASNGLAGLSLPRIAGARAAPLPLPPPAKNPSGPQFSRLHKR